MPSSKFTSQSNLSKCSIKLTGDSESNRWPPTAATVDRLILQLKAKDGDTEANWEKIILNFKRELEAEEKLKPPLTSDVVNCSGSGGLIKESDRDRVRAKFSVPLSRKEMEKDFEDMGERRLPRKPKKRPKSVQNQLDTLFPGLWLTEISADLYRVSDTKRNSFVFIHAKSLMLVFCPTCIVVYRAKGKMVFLHQPPDKSSLRRFLWTSMTSLSDTRAFGFLIWVGRSTPSKNSSSADVICGILRFGGIQKSKVVAVVATMELMSVVSDDWLFRSWEKDILGLMKGSDEEQTSTAIVGMRNN